MLRERQGPFIRFNDLPPGGRSSTVMLFNVPAAPREAGVSVFEAERTREGWAVLLGSNSMLTRSFSAFVCGRRPVYLVYGSVVGRGGDGEPLLTEVELEEIPADVPIYARPSTPALDFWLSVYNSWREGGFRGLCQTFGRTQLRNRAAGRRNNPMQDSENGLRQAEPPSGCLQTMKGEQCQ